MATGRIALLLLVVGLLVPSAEAAAAQGALEATGPLHLPEPMRLDADAGDLLWNASGVPELEIRADGLEVTRVGTRTTVQRTPLGPGASISTEPFHERIQHGASTLTLTAGEDAQLLVLRVQGALDGALSSATVRGVEGVLLAEPWAQARDCPDLCAAAKGVHEMAAQDADLAFDGRIVLFLRGPSLHVQEEGRETEYASGASESSDGTLSTREEAWTIVSIPEGQGTAAAAAPANLYVPTASLATHEAQWSAARGDVSIGVRDVRAAGESLRAKGALDIRLEPLADDHVIGASDKVYAAAFPTRLGGDVAALELGEHPVAIVTPAQAAGILGVLAALGAGATYAWPTLHFQAAALYTRLRKPEILDNDVRSGIYDIIRQNPGISARAVHRQSAQSWGTVVYHLRQLERHHLVVSRTMGRTRNYYENHGKYRGMEAQLACLQSPRARQLAHLILEEPGLTQENLAERSGLPQPTTSYYVRKLKKAGLVGEAREGRYVRYRPQDDLARFVHLAEAGEAPAAPEAPAANA